MKSYSVYANVVVALSMLVTAGCQQTVTTTQNQGLDELRLLGRLYGDYLAQHGGSLPPNEEKFKAFLSKKIGPLDEAGLVSVDRLFLSQRDGEPLVVFYASQPGPEGPGGFPWVAYERTGQAGVRLAVTARGSVEEMDSSQFDEVFSEFIP